MGMRRNIKLVYQDSLVDTPSNRVVNESNCIYLYTHWGADGLEETLANSLIRAKSRWNDENYLARIIFTDMTRNVGDELTGYGLAPYEIDPEFATLVVNLEKNTVNEVPFEDFISKPDMFNI